jgi:hypothetical protein
MLGEKLKTEEHPCADKRPRVHLNRREAVFVCTYPAVFVGINGSVFIFVHHTPALLWGIVFCLFVCFEIVWLKMYYAMIARKDAVRGRGVRCAQLWREIEGYDQIIAAAERPLTIRSLTVTEWLSARAGCFS